MTAGVLAALAVLVGALTQRATGLGFALVAAPFLVVVLGPRDGVSVGNALSIVLCVIVLARTWRRTRWRAVALLAVPAVAVLPLGALTVRSTPTAPLLVGVGSVSVVAVLMVVASGRRTLLRGTAGAVGAGAASGLMNVTAGVGGPMMSAYALSQRWRREELIPTAQAYLLLVNIGSLAVKGMPVVAPVTWWACGAALVVGVLAGEWVAGRVSETTSRRVVIGLALAGGVAAIIRGLLAVA